MTVPAVGIDFGTTNCSMGIWNDGQPLLLPLEGESVRLPSVLFLASKEYVADFSEEELEKRVRSASREQKKDRFEAKSELKSITQELQRARTRLETYKRQLESLDRRNLERRIDGLNKEVDVLKASRKTLKRKVTQLSKPDSELRAEIAKVIKREGLQKSRDAASRLETRDRLFHTRETLFGTQAINRFIDGAEGNFLVSPKSFIGANVGQQQLANFEVMVARILDHLRQAAQNRLSATGLTVIGRPVHFRGGNDAQAERILQRAATEAGFRQVEFFYEPIAAALDYERTMQKDKALLVVDVGGGTTDCSMVRVGPSHRNQQNRDADVIGFDGLPIGGRDLDFVLAQNSASPLLGLGTKLRGGLPFPTYHFRNAFSLSIPGRRAFYSTETKVKLRELANRSCVPETIDRLMKVHRESLADYVLFQSEQAKIELTYASRSILKLDRIEPRLRVSVKRRDFSEFASDTHNKLIGVISNVIRQSGTDPDEVYLTGGMGQSPMLRSALQAHLGEFNLVEGDFFGSVAAGLTTCAYRRTL